MFYFFHRTTNVQIHFLNPFLTDLQSHLLSFTKYLNTYIGFSIG